MLDFTRLYDAFFSRVYNYVRYRVDGAAAADDVTSRIFEKALARLSSFEPRRASADAWLFAIARSTVADHFRAARPEAALDAEPEAGEPSVEDALARDESARELLAATARLDGRSRELLALKFGARMTNRDIAALTGLSESNVGVLIFRAVKTLRSGLGAKA